MICDSCDFRKVYLCDVKYDKKGEYTGGSAMGHEYDA